MDLNGDGKPDLIYVDSNGNWKIRKGIYPPPYLLKKIDNSRGLKVEITYKPSTQFNDPASVPPQPNIDYKPLPYSINVVHMIRVENFGSHSNTLTYKYYKGKYDAATKEFRGFGSVRVENAKGRYDFFGYAQGEYTQGILTSHIVQDKHTLKYYVNTYNTIEERVVNANTHPPIKFPFIAQKGVEFLEGLAPPNTIHPDVKRKLFQYKYDTYGNLTHEIDHTWGSCKKTEYKSDTSGGNYIFATKKVELIPNPSYHPDPNYFTEPCANPPERSTLFFHDGSSADSYITKGNLTKTQQCLNQACTLTSDTSLSYDAYGNVVATVDPRGNISTVGYDSFSQTLVNYKQNALGHKQYFQHDYGTGQITSIRGPNATDPNNIATQGEETKFEYDALGRIIKKYVPVFQNNTYVATLSETWDYSNVNATVPIPVYVEKWVRKSFSSGAGYRTRTYFDGKGAVIQTRTNHTNGNGMCSVIDVGYDSIGRKIKMVRPYASQDWYYSSPTWVNVTEYEYDPMNRIKKVIHPGNTGEISYNYLPWRTEVTNEDGKIKTYISNAMGKIAEVVEHENVFLGSFSTFYSYTKWGELAHILGSEGNAIIYTHDRLGRRTERLSMPPGGMIQNSHQYQYDLSGNLSSKIDNNQNMTEYQYDSLNRVDTVLYPSIPFPSVGGSNGGSLSNEYPLGNITYTYDHPSFLHSIGRLSIVTDETGSTQFEYNARGNLAKKSIYVCISGTPSNCNTYRSYEVSMDYHAFGPVHTITYATGSQPTVVKYDFDDAGRISRVYLDSATNKPVFANFLYNPDGTIQQKISPTNGDNPPGFNTTVQYTYNARGFTTSALGHKTSDSSAIFLQSEYSYMNSGNISFYRDLKNGIEISYEYDDLYRLIGMNSEQVGNRSYLYSKSGNITSKTETDPNNYTTTTWSYGYNGPSPYNGYHGTHAATQLSNNYGKTYEYHYGYNGNMKMKEDTSSSGQLWRYYYDVENRLRQVNLVDKSSGNIASETTFQYRYSGARVRKTTKQGGSTTQDKIYVDNAYEHDLQLDKYDVHVYAGGVKLATIRDAENNHLVYQSHKDKVFNTQVTTDAQGEIADQRGYYPFGSEYGYSMGWQNPLSGLEYRFNDKEFDTATGLYYYGTRYYEPGLSRWLSSDKQMYHLDRVTANPQYFNLYSFSVNNPINYYDPDGAFPLPAIALVFLKGAAFAALFDVALQVGTGLSREENHWGARPKGLSIGFQMAIFRDFENYTELYTTDIAR